MLASAAAACQCFLNRYQLRLRWSLKTMLAAVASAAVFCAWFASARDRANLQDSLIDALDHGLNEVKTERWGPNWLDLFGMDRFRLRIVSVRLDAEWLDMGDAKAEALVKRVGQLRSLQRFKLKVGGLTPAEVDALSNLKQLRTLSIQGKADELLSHECLATIGELTQLEHLELARMTVNAESLSRLQGLTHLKTLAITGLKAPSSDAPLLAHLAPLRGLESLDLTHSQIRDRDLRPLIELPHLRSLGLIGTAVTSAGLAGLSRLDSLEELQIEHSWYDDVKLAADLESLLTLDRLKALHIWEPLSTVQAPASGWPDRTDLPLDFGDALIVYGRDADRVRRALGALRKSRPGIYIDGRRILPSMRWFEAETESFSYEQLPRHDSDWLPKSDVPWMTPLERADFKKAGGWARFDAAGWGTEPEGSTSF
jgi:hypothetical protein